MSTTNDGGPAFPRQHAVASGVYLEGQDGMSLRDWFAGQALAGMIANKTWNAIGLRRAGIPEGESTRAAAVSAYLYADAMLEARGTQ
jgi:hypothetical protein